MGMLEVFGHSLKKFLMWDDQTWFTGILWVLSGVCETWPLWAKFLGPFRSQIGQKFSTEFTRNLIYKLIAATFVGV